MATGPEHYRLAEELLAQITRDDGSVDFGDGGEAYVAAAQVHATLAMAAAAVLGAVAGSAADREAELWMSTITTRRIFRDPDDGFVLTGRDDAFAAGYAAALDDARITSGRETLLECPTHDAAYYAGGECPACAMDAAAAAWAAENGGAA